MAKLPRQQPRPVARADLGPKNFALLNRLAVSVLRQDTRIKAGVKCKRKTAGWNDEYLLHLLLDDS